MYVWMILATFIVVLAAFNLSPRTDLQSQQQTPLAEAALTKFLVQHDAAVKYAKRQLALYHSDPGGHAGLSSGILNGCNDDGNGELCNFLPIGYKYEENLYYSGIYCVNTAQYTDNYNAETGMETRTKIKNEGESLAPDCNDKLNSVVYIITFGRVPERWKNTSTNRILGEYYNAMHSKIAVGSSCGIVVPKKNSGNAEGGGEGTADVRNPLNSKYVIEGIDVQNKSIPLYFIEHEGKFTSKCDVEIDGQFPCIIYVTAL